MDPRSPGHSTLLCIARPCMKKRSPRELRLHLYRSRKEMHRRKRRKGRSDNRVRPQNRSKRAQFYAIIREWGPPRKVELRRGDEISDALGIPLIPPQDFSLERNSAKVIQFLEKFRRRRYTQRIEALPESVTGHPRWIDVYADFTRIQRISTAAALVLAAEFYTAWHHLRVGGAGPVGLIDFEEWHGETKMVLHQLGFLNLFDVKLPVPVESNRHVLQFMTGTGVNSKDAEKLRDGVADLTGKLNVPKSVQLGIYEGLCEAMTNTTEHAYQHRELLKPPFLEGQWWMTGSVTSDGLAMDVVFLDQGISIPAHLPRTWEEKLILVGGDAMMIKAAVEAGRSATDAMNRGRGLAQIQDLVDRAGTGRLRILSRRGEYIYDNNQKNSVRTRALVGDIGGTLIHWRLAVQSG